MKTTVKFLNIILLLSLALSLASCSAAPGENWAGEPYYPDYEEVQPNDNAQDGNANAPEQGSDGTPIFEENAFITTSTQNISTFSADVDTASYSYFRKLVESGYKNIKYQNSAFRTEEFINYFDYDVKAPDEGELFGVTTRILPCPWNLENRLLRLTLRADDAIKSNGNNLVFLIDVSGSMSSADKLPLLKKTFSYLVDNLTENDRISIVTYSGREKVILDGCKGSNKLAINMALLHLNAGGSTNGESGMKKAYEIAEKHFIEGGNNRIIMASDGDLNVGISSANELKSFVSEKKESGVYLSVLGFGTDNYRDSKMEAIADNGNGVYYYIDGESEARKVLGEDLLGTLYTVAEDVKLQITFNENIISEYRLIGYENRILNTEDFEDDKKDAGEVGAGHMVTVCYELKLRDRDEDITEEMTKTEETETTDELMTDNPDAGIEPHEMDENTWLTLAVRHKAPGEDQSRLREYEVGAESIVEDPSDDDKFISCVLRVCMLFHNSKYLDSATTLNTVISELDALDLSNDAYRAEFRDLLKKLAATQQ